MNSGHCRNVKEIWAAFRELCALQVLLFSSISLCLVVLIKSDDRLAPFFFFHVFFFLLLLSICRRVVHRNSSRHTLHIHKTSTGLRYPSTTTSSRRHRPCSAWPTFRARPNLPIPNLFSSLSSGLGERGDAREAATDRREGGRRRGGGPRDAQAEEPPALLSLPNQTRAGAAGTGLLPLWSVPTRRSCDAIAPTAETSRSVVQHLTMHLMQKKKVAAFTSKGIYF